MKNSLLICLIVLNGSHAAETTTSKEIREAVTRALPLLQKGATGHRENRTCFACHNQALPILAMTTARSRGFAIDEDELQRHLEHINDSLDRNRKNFLQGKGTGGQMDTAGYALWTLHMAGWKPNETTDAVAEYMLLYQKDSENWRTSGNRPPSEASLFTVNYLGLRGLEMYGTKEQKERVEKKTKQVRDWLLKSKAKDTEDRVFRLWGLKRAGAEAKDIQAAADELLNSQHEKGGWAQLDTLEPDAYATGSALVALHEASGLATNAAAYQKGIRFLLSTQLPDGSWYVKSRSKPFQTYFETGFPHKKDQFISIAASGWATTALSLALPKETPESLLKRASATLALIDGEIALPGLKDKVEVLRDQWGVPHIYAKNDDDLFLAQGFVAAQDRLFQIDLWRRIGIGETAEIAGKSGLDGDRFARLLRYRGDLEAEWKSYSPDTKRIATAFTRGINAYIDHIGDRLPIEFQLLGTKPKKWRPEDILGRMSGIVMSRNFQNEIARAELIAAVGVEKARRLAPTDPVREFAPVPNFDIKGIDQSILKGFKSATRALKLQPGDEGSNNWTIDGTLSASGKPMLASDPHRAIALPALRYLVHLNAPGWNVIGSGEPALPGVAIGHNERVAWGFTIVGTDQTDVYVEETDPADSSRYKVGDKWEKMTIVLEKVAVRGATDPVEIELRFTRHGPVIHQDAKRHRAYALKWVGNEPGGAAYLGSLALNRAKSGRDFVNALPAWKAPSENMVYADLDGNIGWVASGLTPVRKGWDGLLPVPGMRGEFEWQKFLSTSELPQIHNPPSHYVVTANHNILPPDYKREIAYEWAPRYRFERIKQRFESHKAKFTLDDFKSIQHENTTLPGLALVKLLKEVENKDEKLNPSLELLKSWDGVLSIDSQAGALYGLWLQELLGNFFSRHVSGSLLEFVSGRSGVPVLLSALGNPDMFWFGDNPRKGRDELLLRSLQSAVTKLQGKPTGQAKEPKTWGDLHRVTFHHPLASLGPIHAKTFNLGPRPTPGDGHTPNAASHNASFEHMSGASYRHLFDLADWDKGMATSVPGQSGQPGSPHYADLLPLWEKGQYFPLAFSRKKVEEVTKNRLLLKPGSK